MEFDPWYSGSISSKDVEEFKRFSEDFLKDLTPAEAKEILMDMGIVDENGELTEEYRRI